MEPLTIGRYHSLVAESVPECLTVTARTADNVVMAVEHKSLPVSAVQFHPESILSLKGKAGECLIRNVVRQVTMHDRVQGAGSKVQAGIA